MRHGDQGTPDIGQLEQVLEEFRVLLRLDAHRYDDSVDAVVLEPWVVDKRRLEGVGRIAHVCDQGGRPADHFCSLLLWRSIAWREMRWLVHGGGDLQGLVDVHA